MFFYEHKLQLFARLKTAFLADKFKSKGRKDYARRKACRKKAIVSGGSRGIGRGIALTLAAEGADVAFCHYKDDEKASQTVADIEALGRKAFAADCDVSSTSAIKDFYAASVNSIGDIDILLIMLGTILRRTSKI